MRLGGGRSGRWGGAALAGCLILLTVACSSGGGGGGGPTTPAGISFRPSGTPGAETLYLTQGAASTPTLLILELRAQQVTDLFGINAQIDYPTSLMSFSEASEGPMLRANGNFKTSFLVAEREAGAVVVGLTRLGPVSGANGSGLLARFEFTSRQIDGSAPITFSHNEAYSSQGGTEKVGMSWLGGTVTVVP